MKFKSLLFCILVTHVISDSELENLYIEGEVGLVV